MRAILLVMLAVLALGPGCHADPGSDPLGRRLTLHETVRIDGHSAELGRITDVAMLPGGVIAVAEFREGAIKFFSPTGSLLGTFGRDGDGPGEFRLITDIMVLGDTVWVMDFGLRRVTATDERYQLLDVRPLPELPRLSSTYADVGHAGRLLEGVSVLVLASDMVANKSVLMRVANNDGVRPLVSLGMARGHPMIEVDGGTMAADLLPDIPEWSIAPGGDRLAVAYSVRTQGADEGRLHILAVDAKGDTLFETTYPYVPRRITTDLADSIVDEQVRHLPTRVRGAYRREVRIPEVFPPVVEMVFTVDGELWIRMEDAREGHDYVILRRDGTLRGHAAVADNIRVVTGTRSHVWALETDSVDVHSIIRYDVRGTQ